MLLCRYFPWEDKILQIGGSRELGSEGAYITKLKQNSFCQHQNAKCSCCFRRLLKQENMAAGGYDWPGSQSEQKMLQNVEDYTVMVTPHFSLKQCCCMIQIPGRSCRSNSKARKCTVTLFNNQKNLFCQRKIEIYEQTLYCEAGVP